MILNNDKKKKKMIATAMGIACASGSGCCLQKQTNESETGTKERKEHVIKDNILL